MTPVPSVGDLRARRLDATREALRERLLAGTSDELRSVVDALAQEFDVRDVAAVAIAMVEEARAPRARRARAGAGYNAVTANDASSVAAADRSHVGSGPAR